MAAQRWFARAGAGVVLADINESLVRSVAGELSEAGLAAVAAPCDVSDEDQVAATVARTVETFGGLDMAFNNAGIIDPPSETADEPAENYDRVNTVNARGVWACMNCWANGSSLVVKKLPGNRLLVF